MLTVTTRRPSYEEWEGFIKTLPYKSFLMSYAWSIFLKEYFKEIVFWAGYQDNKLSVVFSGVVHKAKRGKFLEFRHGPFCDWGNIELSNEVLEFLREKAKSLRVWGVRFHPYVPVKKWQEIKKQIRSRVFSSQLHERDYTRTAILDLKGKGFQDIFKNFSKTHKKRIRRAQRLDLKVIDDTKNLTYFDWFLDIYYSTVRFKGWRDKPKEYYKLFIDIFRKYNLARFYVILYKKTPIYGSIHIFYQNTVWPFISATDLQYRKLSPSYFFRAWILDKVIKEGYLRYDFAGIGPDDPSNPLFGVRMHKLGFGAKEVLFAHVQELAVSPLWHLTRLYEWFERKRLGW